MTGPSAAGRGTQAGLRPAPTPLVVAGLGAPVVFVGTFTVAGWLRPGYDPVSMFVSELSIGPGGWVQQAGFVVSGALVVLFAVAASRAMRGGRGHRAGPLAIGLLGLCLALSGLFTTDPSAMFDQVTWHGVVHGLLGAVVFSCMPIGCLVVAARLRGVPSAAGFRRWSLTAGAALVVLIVALRTSQSPQTALWPWRGLVQRADLLLHMTWLATFALRVLRARG